jgi:hypothetical protein
MTIDISEPKDMTYRKINKQLRIFSPLLKEAVEA